MSRAQHEQEAAALTPVLVNAHAPDYLTVGLPDIIALLQRPEHVPRAYWLGKRLFDVALSAVLLVMGIPFFVLIALAVKCDSSGPVLFCQLRMGRGLQLFKIFKFRTMYEGANSTPVAILDETGKLRRPNFQADPRVTRVGKVLRRFSMDELPQLANILSGDMSFIGPRPLTLAESMMVPPLALARYSVPSGLTGLAQVRDRHIMLETSRFNHDIEFVQQVSVKLDLKIIFKTFFKLYDPG